MPANLKYEIAIAPTLIAIIKTMAIVEPFFIFLKRPLRSAIFQPPSTAQTTTGNVQKYIMKKQNEKIATSNRILNNLRRGR